MPNEIQNLVETFTKANETIEKIIAEIDTKRGLSSEESARVKEIKGKIKALRGELKELTKGKGDDKDVESLKALRAKLKDAKASRKAARADLLAKRKEITEVMRSIKSADGSKGKRKGKSPLAEGLKEDKDKLGKLGKIEQKKQKSKGK